MSDFESILKKKWGYSSFRPLQKEIISSITSGKDTVALLPTGAGKSLTYQLPAVAMDGIAIVVTPLISLMYDQVKSLRDRQILAAYINSGMSSYDIDRILDNCVYGDIKLLYISPERIDSWIFKARVTRMKVSLVAIDEAHCISQWGYDFRPSYLKVWHLREMLPGVPFLALTATATSIVLDDISRRLMLDKPNIFVSSFERKNLRFVVREAQDKKAKLLQIISVLHPSWCGIIYCRTRNRTVEISDYLAKNNVSSDFYHAGLDSKTRNLKQKLWMEGEKNVMVATSAFGMGIDKPNVRYVIHYDMPDSLEEYYQQAGRAGRDGKDSYAVALFSSGDINTVRLRIMDEFPQLDVVKQVYDSLCRFLSIALEYGQGTVKKFSLLQFSKYCKLYSSKVVSSLKILQSNGYLTYYEENERPTRIIFSVSRDALYNFKIENEYDDIVIAAILRNYAGVFSQFTPISEQFLSRVTGIDEDSIPSILIRLSRQHIIRYIPRNNDPVVRFEMDRVSISDLVIAPDTYIVRRNNLSLMTSFVAEYLVQSSRCRMQLLCGYFDQKAVGKCLHCDICGTQRNIPQYENYTDDEVVDELIVKALKSANNSIKSVDELSTLLPVAKFEILLSLRRLLWKKIVYEMPDGSLKLRVS